MYYFKEIKITGKIGQYKYSGICYKTENKGNMRHDQVNHLHTYGRDSYNLKKFIKIKKIVLGPL